MVTDIGYPLNVPRPKLSLTSAPASLDALLGRQRAQLLRTVGRPTSNSRLAERLHIVPSAVTHHVTALESAGLVIRHRKGRNVTVRRTPRGEALLALYATA
jgi:DNA-binding MarR family transcriptional regulator